MTGLSVHQSDDLWVETVLMSGCFDVQSSVAVALPAHFLTLDM